MLQGSGRGQATGGTRAFDVIVAVVYNEDGEKNLQRDSSPNFQLSSELKRIAKRHNGHPSR